MSLPFVIFHTDIDQKKMTMTLDAFCMDRGYERLSIILRGGFASWRES